MSFRADRRKVQQGLGSALRGPTNATPGRVLPLLALALLLPLISALAGPRDVRGADAAWSASPGGEWAATSGAAGLDVGNADDALPPSAAPSAPGETTMIATAGLAAAMPAPAVAQSPDPDTTAPSGAVSWGASAVRVEVRVWQDLGSPERIHVSARPTGGSWRTPGLVRLLLDDGLSRSGRFRYGDIVLDVPLANRSLPASVQLRVWQDVSHALRIYVSARPVGGSWEALGTTRLLLDDGITSTRALAPLGEGPDSSLRFGDFSIEVPLLDEGVSTLAGTPGVWGYRNGRGTEARFGGYAGRGNLALAVDHDGSVVAADGRNHAIRRIALDGTVTTIAGGNGAGLRDGPAETAQFDRPNGVAVDGTGAIYVTDSGNSRIRRISLEGMVTTVAGTDPPAAESSGTRDGPALEALFHGVRGLAVDVYGDLYIIERYAVRLLSPSGWVSTFAGTTHGWRDGPKDQAQFQGLQEIAVDDAGNLYLIDENRGAIGTGDGAIAIRKIDAAGMVSTLYRGAYQSVGGTLGSPSGVAATGDGTVYIANTGRHQIVRLTEDGELRAVAGSGARGLLDGPHASAAFNAPEALAVSPDGSLVVADQDGSVIRRILPPGGGFGSVEVLLADFEELPLVSGVTVTVLAGRGAQGFVDGPARQAGFRLPEGLAMDREGNVLVADTGNHAIRRVAPDGTVTTVAGGNGEGLRDGPCEAARFASPVDVAVDDDGYIYVADRGSNRIRGISAQCVVTTIAGSGPVSSDEAGWGGYRDGPAAEARFDGLSALAIGPEGSLYIAQGGYNLLRRLSPDGQVSTIAGPAGGTRTPYYNPGIRDGPAHSALFSSPWALAIDGEGNILFTEGNHAVRKVDLDGFVSTVVVTPGTRLGGALSPFLFGIAVGPDGDLYVADGGWERVVRVTDGGAISIDDEVELAMHRPRSLALPGHPLPFTASAPARRDARGAGRRAARRRGP